MSACHRLDEPPCTACGYDRTCGKCGGEGRIGYGDTCPGCEGTGACQTCTPNRRPHGESAAHPSNEGDLS